VNRLIAPRIWCGTPKLPANNHPIKTAQAMADAIIKVSWRRLANGFVREGVGQAQGGIAGTCFTLTSGISLSCAHGHDSALFRPNPGFDDCRLWIVETSGRIVELKQRQFRLFPEYDAAIIDGFQSRTKYKTSTKKPDEIKNCNLIGYTAHASPFSVGMTPDRQSLQIYAPNIISAEQGLRVCPETSRGIAKFSEHEAD
jgi:hypothetical protein